MWPSEQKGLTFPSPPACSSGRRPDTLGPMQSNDSSASQATATSSSETEHETTTLVILGASGDLTSRLLLPGLGTLLKAEPERRIRLVGAGREELSHDDWQQLVRRTLSVGGCTDERIEQIVEAARYTQGDILGEEGSSWLRDQIEGRTVIYFALPPAITLKACEALADRPLPANVTLALEKPFGADLESARHLNRVLASMAREEQIFRVDHFLGRGTVLNLLGLRFANRIFEPVWNTDNIESIEVVFDEDLALEGRAAYYDNAGAMVDMLQSHLLLVLAMVAMEQPAKLDAVDFRDLQAHLLRSTHLWSADATESSRRARYTAGEIDGRAVPSYVDEEGVDPERGTETLAEVKVRIDNSRWANVPITLRSGKAIGEPKYRVVVHFKRVAHLPELFGDDVVPHNALTLDIKPGRIEMLVTTNGAGHRFQLEHTVLEADLPDSPVRPYGEILAGILDENPLLGVRSDVAEECWRIVTPVVEAWRAGEVPMDEYPAGSTGPEHWEQLL
ncbi:glucose-6-phosphate 1-dehydrogenase [Propioniferax innocua]|uniref:Glucose-6-phosphate 1-dehydrogenase n=2 Tax=Propioniferax innocua TaxID=1753 RepID=A0A542ZCZ4_9ACTN|nr:glucose-6-phosphate 1-dehydrogenase [Propioniferax innocua]